jgi:AraC-like DNA-binding protein
MHGDGPDLHGDEPDLLSEPGDGAPLVGRLAAVAESLRGRAGWDGTSAAARPAGFLRLLHTDAPRTEHRALDAPWLLVVLMGAARVSAGSVAVQAGPGDVVILPARILLEVALAPGPAGAFEGFEVEVLAEAVLRWLPADLDIAAEVGSTVPRARRPGRAALEGVVAFCEGVFAPDTHPWTLEHRLAGILLALALESSADAARTERTRARLDLTLAVRQLVRARPDASWSAARVAQRLGLSIATLRRRLSGQGTGLRRLLQEERMALARTLLADGRLNVSEVALRCGYDSPAKFARQFRRTFGMVPSRYRPIDPH